MARTIAVDGEVVGIITSFDRDGDHEVTYWIGRVFWGRGIATAALRAFLSEDVERPVFGRDDSGERIGISDHESVALAVEFKKNGPDPPRREL